MKEIDLLCDLEDSDCILDIIEVEKSMDEGEDIIDDYEDTPIDLDND